MASQSSEVTAEAQKQAEREVTEHQALHRPLPTQRMTQGPQTARATMERSSAQCSRARGRAEARGRRARELQGLFPNAATSAEEGWEAFPLPLLIFFFLFLKVADTTGNQSFQPFLHSCHRTCTGPLRTWRKWRYWFAKYGILHLLNAWHWILWPIQKKVYFHIEHKLYIPSRVQNQKDIELYYVSRC